MTKNEALQSIRTKLHTVNDKQEMDRKIIGYLDTHLSQRVAIEYEIRKQELRRVIMEALEKAVEENKIQINTVEDFCILAELDLMLIQ